jgi:hypothetical protein
MGWWWFYGRPAQHSAVVLLEELDTWLWRCFGPCGRHAMEQPNMFQRAFYADMFLDWLCAVAMVSPVGERLPGGSPWVAAVLKSGRGAVKVTVLADRRHPVHRAASVHGGSSPLVPLSGHGADTETLPG